MGRLLFRTAAKLTQKQLEKDDGSRVRSAPMNSVDWGFRPKPMPTISLCLLHFGHKPSAICSDRSCHFLDRTRSWYGGHPGLFKLQLICFCLCSLAIESFKSHQHSLCGVSTPRALGALLTQGHRKLDTSTAATAKARAYGLI